MSVAAIVFYAMLCICEPMPTSSRNSCVAVAAASNRACSVVRAADFTRTDAACHAILDRGGSRLSLVTVSLPPDAARQNRPVVELGRIATTHCNKFGTQLYICGVHLVEQCVAQHVWTLLARR